MISIALTNEQEVDVTINPQTDKKKPVAVDGVPVWEVVSGDATLRVAEDGKSAVIVSPDTPGQSQVLVKVDADLGQGVVEISEVFEVTVAGALATNLGAVVGTPRVKE